MQVIQQSPNQIQDIPTDYWVTVSPKGGITIPAILRQKLGVKNNDRLAIRIKEQKLEIESASLSLAEAAGSVPALAEPKTFEEMREVVAQERAEKYMPDDQK